MTTSKFLERMRASAKSTRRRQKPRWRPTLDMLEGRVLLTGLPELLKDINPDPPDPTDPPEGLGSGIVSGFTNVGGIAYFGADDGVTGRELWRSNGTTAGTFLLKDIQPNISFPFGSNPHDLTNVGGTLFFSASDTNDGDELWKSNGTAPGTVRVEDINPGPDSSSPTFLTAVGGTVFFAAFDNGRGTELWKSDGTPAGTVRVMDINPGTGSSEPSYLTNVGGTLFFTARDNVHGTELWKSDGTSTVLVKDINPGVAGSQLAELTNVGGTLFFTAFDDSGGFELWKSNGTAAGTVRVADIVPGNGSSLPLDLTDVNGTLYFTASSSDFSQDLWKSDGTAAGTVLVKDYSPTNATPVFLTNVGGTLFFSAGDGDEGRELWKSDGTAAGTVRIKDIVPGSGGSEPFGLISVGSTAYFSASSYERRHRSRAVDKRRHGPGTFRVMDINSQFGSDPEQFSIVAGAPVLCRRRRRSTVQSRGSCVTLGAIYPPPPMPAGPTP